MNIKSMARGEFPSQEQLENLKYYKYAAVDKSFITKYILVHYWNWAITLFPMWIAPNLITLIGLFFMIFNVILVAIYVPSLSASEDAPNWIYFSFAAGLWLYSTFDNVDGKQARRTGTSSPLGELFDHGCDALNTTYISLLHAAAIGSGHTPLTVVLFAVTMAGFYLSTAEEYYTGVLYLGYVNGPTEGIILTCIAFIISGFYGAGIWQLPLEDISLVSWITPLLNPGTTGAQVFVWMTTILFFLTHCPVVLYTMYSACKEKSLNWIHVFYTSLGPIVLFCLAEYAWLTSPDSIIFKGQHLILFNLMAGTLFGLMASNIIFSHLTKSPFPSLAGSVAPMVIMSLLVNAPSFINMRLISADWEYYMVWTLFVSAVSYYAVWASLVINGFCRYLGIRCLVIRRNKPVSRTMPSEEIAEDDSLLEAQEEGEVVSPKDDNMAYSTFH
ncbi:CDP-alcohol phosphatidyltransferase-domain-containing protein [Phycomyces blakesleeanus]|uniref:Uncharacterized protein n=2 Tax=Phycomyces blakesleeanus TaxID=4837 RepID=A0A162WD80_PHYB8|nr:hypothetical protein PHYBLDRAFT_128641 [Phycomyces blakesleeanus NRRL 1555(-)]OAD66335.1 hypothetical protein PHYBLDRAFT_128641 [Phycomyces blakesleeanus NRRL 1555(-)]|eukprot:XP_018284375.1 hypothetical protein PHYBLDRAFT_128641 [Phycomyces blakesleeanus NRRL 1555(-)]